MNNNRVLKDYVSQQRASGVADEIIKNALIQSGWTAEQINQALLDNMTTNESTISENDYPIQQRWIAKYVIGNCIGLVFWTLLTLGSSYRLLTTTFVYLVISTIQIVVVYLRRKYYRYELQSQYLFLHQGVLNKQQRSIPYGVIQHVFVKQDILDRVLGLASLTIENAASGAGASNIFTRYAVKNKKNVNQDIIGFSGNSISIPGLLKDDAEALKTHVLTKMKENPIEDKQSGL